MDRQNILNNTDFFSTFIIFRICMPVAKTISPVKINARICQSLQRFFKVRNSYSKRNYRNHESLHLELIITTLLLSPPPHLSPHLSPRLHPHTFSETLSQIYWFICFVLSACLYICAGGRACAIPLVSASDKVVY